MTASSSKDPKIPSMEDLELGPPVLLSPAHDGVGDSDTGHRLVVRELVELAELDPSQQRFMPIGPSSVSDVGLELEVVPRAKPVLLAASSVWGSPLAVFPMPGPAPSIRQDADDEGTWYLAMPHGARALVQRSGRPACVLALETGGVVFRKAWLRTAADRTPDLDGPIDDWLRGCRDEWLCKEVRARASQGHPYGVLTAAGACARLRQYSPEEARSTLSRILEGDGSPELEAPLKWWRGVPDEKRRWLQAHALVEAEALLDSLQDLTANLEIYDKAWAAELDDARRQREDHEGVVYVMRATGGHEALVRVLDEVDALGRRLAGLLPTHFFPDDDERSRRTRLLDPGKWWTDGAPTWD